MSKKNFFGSISGAILKNTGSIVGGFGKVQGKILKMGGNFSKKKNSEDKKIFSNNEVNLR